MKRVERRMAARVKVCEYSSFGVRTLKSGETRLYPTTSTVYYALKLHHPDANEMAAVRADLANGMTKKDAAAKYGLGTYQRLSRLLKKWPAP